MTLIMQKKKTKDDVLHYTVSKHPECIV